MIDVVIACIQIIQHMKNIHDDLKGNWTTCIRLCDRCAIFVATLERLKDHPALITDMVSTALKRLNDVLKDSEAYMKEFMKSTAVGFLSRLAFRKTHANEIANLTKRLNQCSLDLSIIQTIDYEVQRRDDMADFRLMFEMGMKAQMDAMNQQGANMESILSQMRQDVKDNKLGMEYMLTSMNYRQLSQEETKVITSENERILVDMERNHKEVMTRLASMENKIDAIGLGQEMMMKLLSNAVLSKDETCRRDQYLNELKLSRTSVTLINKIGQGGFGDIYLGSLNQTQDIAVKKIRVENQQNNQDLRKEIENELLMMRYIGNCPTILPVYGYTQDSANDLMIVMELSLFGSLSMYLYDKEHFPAFPIALSLSWTCDIANAMAHIHRKKIKHRDIKAENLLVFERFRLKLCDFGLAKEHHSFRANKQSTAGGTHGFMPPEALLGKPTSFASDVFAAAMTCVQILSRSYPRIGDLNAQIDRSIEVASLAQTQIQPQPDWLKPISKMDALRALLLRCVAYDPTELNPPDILRPNADQMLENLLPIRDANGGDIRNSVTAMRQWTHIAEELSDARIRSNETLSAKSTSAKNTANNSDVSGKTSNKSTPGGNPNPGMFTRLLMSIGRMCQGKQNASKSNMENFPESELIEEEVYMSDKADKDISDKANAYRADSGKVFMSDNEENMAECGTPLPEDNELTSESVSNKTPNALPGELAVQPEKVTLPRIENVKQAIANSKCMEDVSTFTSVMSDVSRLCKGNKDNQEAFNDCIDGIVIYGDIHINNEAACIQVMDAINYLCRYDGQSYKTHNDKNINKLAERGVKLIIDGLTKHMSSTTAANLCCCALSAITTTDDIKTMIFNFGGIEAVISALKLHVGNPKVSEAGCRALGTIAYSSSSSQIKITTSGGIDAIVNAISQHLSDASVTESGSRSLGNIAYGLSNAQVKASTATSMNVILSAMTANAANANVLEAGCRALWYITYNNHESKNKLISLHGIDSIITAMKQHVSFAALSEVACRALGNLVFKNPTVVSKVFSLGGIEAVIASLAQHLSHAGVCKSVCWLFRILSAADDQAKMFSLGGIELVIAAIKQHMTQTEVAEGGCWTLGNLAGHTASSAKIISSDGINVILAVIAQYENHAGIIEAGCRALANICTSDDTVSKLIDVDRILTVAKQYMDNEKIAEACCRILGTMANQEENQVKIASLNGCQVIISTIKRHLKVPGVVEAGCRALFALAFNHDNKVTIASLGGIDLAINVIKFNTTNPVVSEAACRILGNLSYKNEDNKIKISSHGGIEIMTNSMILLVNDATFSESVCYTLGNLAYKNPIICGKLSVKKSIDAIVATMVQHGGNPRVCEYGCRLLGIMAFKNQTIKNEIVNNKGLDVIVAALQQHLNNCGVAERACVALSNLAYKSDNLLPKVVCVNVIGLATEAMNIHMQRNDVASAGCRLLWALFGKYRKNMSGCLSVLERVHERHEVEHASDMLNALRTLNN